jgi:thiol-disulfide isomerase/thioredoxin
MRTTIASFALALLILSPAARAEGLSIGDPAPALSVSKWVKGDKVDKLEKGQIYVVEFWATWCGPCRATIPHLTQLQKKNPGVTFIGVSILENDQKGVEPFVKEMGDKMDYRVAMDDATNRGDGKMAKNWFEAAGENGIPTAFIINKEGKIAWIGHPASMDGPLAKIVDGSYDLKAAISERAEAKAAEAAMEDLGRKVGPLMRDKAKNAKAIAEILGKAIADNPGLEKTVGYLKFEAMIPGDKEAASAYGNKLVDSVYKDNEGALNYMAWAIVDPDAKFDASKRDVKLAVKAAKRACELGKYENPQILDTLALATFLSGDAAKALELQEKAVKMMDEKDPEVMARLEKYRKAAGK